MRFGPLSRQKQRTWPPLFAKLNGPLRSTRTNIDALLYALKKLSDRDPDTALKLLASTAPDPKDDLRVSLLKVQIFAEKGGFATSRTPAQEAGFPIPSILPTATNSSRSTSLNGSFDEAEKELRGFAAANPADSQAGLNVVCFLNGTRGPLAAREQSWRRALKLAATRSTTRWRWLNLALRKEK